MDEDTDEDEFFNGPAKEVFDRIGNSLDFWVLRAEALFSAADAVEAECGIGPHEPHDLEVVLKWAEMHGVVRMLRGMAFECVFKGLWLKFGGTLASDGKYRKIPDTKDHDLCSLERKLSEVVDLEATDEERRTLGRLSFFITYGRYPIRRSMSEPHPSAPAGDGPMLWCQWTPEELIACAQLQERLWEKLTQ